LAPPIQGANGSIYGTTLTGGAFSGGTVYQVTLSGVQTTLHSFDGADGTLVQAPLIQGTDGNFYGTTVEGGVNSQGTIFKITPTGTLTTLYNFCAQPNCIDGEEPVTGLAQATDGKLYGTTSTAGVGGGGTVFSLDVGLGPFVKAQPTMGRVGSNVSILGTSLTCASSVTFNGVAATFTIASPSLIKATVPSGATTGSVRVTTPSGVLKSSVVFRVEH
jgi:uncharacterized repeat protein (TIGR03803 family)